MPIRPENKTRYPKDWPQIRERDDAFADERFLHVFLVDKHAHGEWFMISAQEAIEHVRDAVGYGNHFRDRENAA